MVNVRAVEGEAPGAWEPAKEQPGRPSLRGRTLHLLERILRAESCTSNPENGCRIGAGVVLAESASGATLFMEPNEALPLNNAEVRPFTFMNPPTASYGTHMRHAHLLGCSSLPQVGGQHVCQPFSDGCDNQPFLHTSGRVGGLSTLYSITHYARTSHQRVGVCSVRFA